jgi:hypothetical protein
MRTEGPEGRERINEISPLSASIIHKMGGLLDIVSHALTILKILAHPVSYADKS